MTGTQMTMAAVAGYVAWRLLRRERYEWKNRVVLVTGGSRGLGLVLARQLAKQGAILILCARDGQELRVAVDDIVSRGGHAVGLAADLSIAEEAGEMVAAIIERFGRIDVVINTAGIIQVGPVASLSLDDFHETMNNNFWSAVHVVRAATPHMKLAGGGRIVNVSSIGGKIAVPHLAAYCASKFALVGYSQTLRAELAQEGIVVTTVCPGLMRTGSHGNAFFKGNHRAEYAWFSISGSLPLATISAESAAQQILRACERGDAELILTLPAKLAAMANQFAPSLTSAAMALVNRLLPHGENDKQAPVRGFDSHSALAPSILTRLNEVAAEANNELTAQDRSRVSLCSR